MTCSYCDQLAVRCSTVQVGNAPNDPRKLNTKQDDRRVIVVRACADHLDRLGTP